MYMASTIQLRLKASQEIWGKVTNHTNKKKKSSKLECGILYKITG